MGLPFRLVALFALVAFRDKVKFQFDRPVGAVKRKAVGREVTCKITPVASNPTPAQCSMSNYECFCAHLADNSLLISPPRKAEICPPLRRGEVRRHVQESEWTSRARRGQRVGATMGTTAANSALPNHLSRSHHQTIKT